VSHLELAMARNERGEEQASRKAFQAALEVKFVGSFHGGLSGGGGSRSSRLTKHPRLPQGSVKKGIKARFIWFRLAVGPCRQP
jgi:hypothetical protein